MAEPLTREAARPAPGGRLSLPNGLSVACQTAAEARFFYHDIFEKRVYHRHGIRLEGARCVLDVGANIGLFTLFVCRYCPEATVYAFEPAPGLFELLGANTASFGERVRRFGCALSDRRGEGELTFYLNSSGMSSLYPDRDEERRNLEAIFANQRRQGVDGVDEVLRHAEDLLEERLRSERVRVPLRTLSEVIREQGIDRIDLLKVDVQKSEADVLAGIEPADWPRVLQAVVEVHDQDGRMAAVTRLLEREGFAVVAEQDDLYEGSNVFNLYAARPGASPDGTALAPARRRAELLSAARRRQRDGGGSEDA